MLKILFFGQLKDMLKTSALELDWQQDNQTLDTVSKLRQYLQTKEQGWQEYLQVGKVLVAVNQELVQDEQVISDSDEIAFFPPVTGG
ncbi:molybdopterin converting factor subunit 1 [Paraglaciecola aquimarina]|uniref:Molybdopterin converting factor subunit 1 n=1 Tax=Paraglaciecola algarum TaxID=3050085 RepID=A0ABS9D880_9ALTE|nr:molybdopterin converting factor subunit 1 [Paraglaciecola sp. G1-23]MCF2949000.1 molybdopterin converting factor subunit 1 [Paraglaciecola sp. G1-23]